MKEHPILFSTPMVQAILEGRKTQTRRIMKRIPRLSDSIEWAGNYLKEKEDFRHSLCPYGQPGDLLWVRETWCVTQPFDPETYHFGYKCGIQPYSNKPASEKYNYLSPDKWKPSIHMPKAADRIWLEIEEVKVERLQDITEEDAKAEGVKLHKEGRHYLDYIAEDSNTTQFIYRLLTAKQSFKSLWELVNERNKSFIERHGICWIDNPWVWVIKFKVISTTGKPDIQEFTHSRIHAL